MCVDICVCYHHAQTVFYVHSYFETVNHQEPEWMTFRCSVSKMSHVVKAVTGILRWLMLAEVCKNEIIACTIFK